MVVRNILMIFSLALFTVVWGVAIAGAVEKVSAKKKCVDACQLERTRCAVANPSSFVVPCEFPLQMCLAKCK